MTVNQQKNNKEILLINKDIYTSIISGLNTKKGPDIRIADLILIFNFNERGISRQKAQKELNELFINRISNNNIVKLFLDECNQLLDYIDKLDIKHSAYFKNNVSFKLFLCECYLKLLGNKFGFYIEDLINNMIDELVKDAYFKEMERYDLYLMCYEIGLNMTKYSTYFHMDNIFVGDKRRIVLKPTEKGLEMFQFTTELIGKKFPSLIKPIIDDNHLIRTSYKNAGKTILNEGSKNVVRYLSGIKYRINKNLLEYLIDNKEDWMTNSIIPFSVVDNLNVKHAYKLIMAEYQKYLDESTTLQLAGALKNVDYFYFNMFMDWRGRFYSIGDYINYQGNKLGLSLLEFHEGKEIGFEGLMFIKIYGANLYGIKGTITSRLKWITENHNNIISMNKSFMKKAKEYTLFIAFVLEYKKILSMKDPFKYKSHFPVLVDCTCNGLQHLSALVADYELGKNVNLVESKDYYDIYNELAVKCTKIIKQQYGLMITRDLIKKVVMTIPYNASKHTIAAYLSDHFTLSPSDGLYYYKEIGLSYKNIYDIGSLISNEFYRSNSKIKDLSEYFKNWAKLLSILEIPIRWETPTGLLIIQDYKKFESKDFKLSKIKRTISIKIPTDIISSQKQMNSLMPNIIHSLDAANIVNVINYIQKTNLNLLTIHDCFGTHASDIHLIQKYVKQGFVSLYCKRDFINKFHETCVKSISEYDNYFIDNNTIYYQDQIFQIPEKPILGILELEKIVNSIYMLS